MFVKASDTLLFANYSWQSVQPSLIAPHENVPHVDQDISCLRQVQPSQTSSQLSEYPYKANLSCPIYSDTLTFQQQFCDDTSVDSTRALGSFIDSVRFNKVIWLWFHFEHFQNNNDAFKGTKRKGGRPRSKTPTEDILRSRRRVE